MVPDQTPARHFQLCGLIAIYLVLIYSNTLHVPFVWDDLSGILSREDFQLTRLTPDTVAAVFLKDGKLYRPLSCLSLAFNYYLGRHNVVGYHLVNLGIHLITAAFLYKTICILLLLGRVHLTRKQQMFTAGLATIFWAAHPMQTQAATYIIQRMASLATMFYVCGLWAYLRYRQHGRDTHDKYRIKWLLFAFCCFLSGVFSKPNAALFPAGILLVEFYFFDGYLKIRRFPLRTSFLLMACLIALVLLGAALTDIRQIVANAYDIRPFTLTQRLLTEPRVLIFYLSLLFYPIASRFSVDHFFVLSTSLFSPPSTFWAIAFLIIGLLAGLLVVRRFPLFGFSVMFYFVHHLVESSVIPLAFAYEHRNYLPSLFVFLPIASLLVQGVSFYGERQPAMAGFLSFFCIVVVFFLGLSTYTRNQEWRSPESLWKKGVAVAPEVLRPYMALGWYYTRSGSRDLKKALWYDYQGVEKDEYAFIFEKADLWLNIARIHKQTGHFSKAREAALNGLASYRKWIKQRPQLAEREDMRRHIAGAYDLLAQICLYINIDEAMTYINEALSLIDSPEYYKIRAAYLMQAGQYAGASQSLRQALFITKKDPEIYLGMAQAMTLDGHYDRGFWFYSRYIEKTGPPGADTAPVYLYLAENRYLAGDKGLGDIYIRRYIQLTSKRDVEAFMERVRRCDPGLIPFVDSDNMVAKIKYQLGRLCGVIT